MILFLKLFSLCLLLAIFYQDLKYRAVSWLFFPVLLILFALLQGNNQTWENILFNYFLNICFIFCQLAFLFVYLFIKQKKLANPMTNQLGWGDVLFWVVAAASFSTANFILFIFSSLTFALLAYGIIFITKAQASRLIPLAGLQALYLFLIQATVFSAGNFMQMHDDSLTLNLLEKWLIN